MKANAWQKGRLVVLALVVLVVAAAVVAPTTIVPVVAGAVAQAGDGSTAAECQSGHSCGGAPVAVMYPGHIKWPGYECQSGTACGGRLIPQPHWGQGMIAVWPLPGTNAVCQSDFACGG